jgi:hypothetical protein
LVEVESVAAERARVGAEKTCERVLPCATDRRPHSAPGPVALSGRQVPSPSETRATSTPDAIWAVGRHPPDSSGTPTCRAHARLSVTLTTTALDRSSSRRLAASASTAAAEGHQGKQRPAPPSPTPRRATRSLYIQLLQRSWHTTGRAAGAQVDSAASRRTGDRRGATGCPQIQHWLGCRAGGTHAC